VERDAEAGAPPASATTGRSRQAPPPRRSSRWRSAWRCRDAIRRVAAGAVATASFLLFLDGLSLAGAGAALTLRNTSVVFAQLLALLLGERVPARQWIGAAFVAAGAAVLSWPGRS
jgi:drug/metabolite transporter (DMT)-like permease